MDEIIKKLFLDLEKEKPFSSGMLFKFFGYTRHQTFKRFLDNPKYYKYLLWHEFEKVETRKSDTINFDREFFLILCERKKIDIKIYNEYFLEYHKLLIDEKTSNFITITKGSSFHNLKMYNLPAGKYYNHSLNTINLARVLNISPYVLFEYCSTELKHSIDYVGVDILNKYSSYSSASHIPYYHFDHKFYSNRNEYCVLIKLLIKEYVFTPHQLELAKYYLKKIDEMLMIQLQIDHKKKFSAEKSKKRKLKGNIIKHSSVEFKKLYRDGCKLFHPDKNPNNEDLFKELVKFYSENEYYKMLLLISTYKKTPLT